MIKNKMQKRVAINTAATFRVREAEGDGTSRVIEGYALKFGVRSRLLCDWWDNYYEVLEPGCITREMLDKQDIKLTMFHDRQLLLARSNGGKGTLNYEVDNEGVRFWAEMPNTADGDKALELVKRGDIDGCSFCYSTDEEDSENAVSYERIKENGEDVLLRHVKRVDNVYDFTITPDPAYLQTSVTQREVEAAGVSFREDEEKPKDEPEADNGEDETDNSADKETGGEDKEEKREINLQKKRALLREVRDRINRKLS